MEAFRRKRLASLLREPKRKTHAALLVSFVAAAADDDDDDDECKRTGREISFASISSSVSETKNNEGAIVFLAVKDARKKGRRREGLFVSVRNSIEPTNPSRATRTTTTTHVRIC